MCPRVVMQWHSLGHLVCVPFVLVTFLEYWTFDSVKAHPWTSAFSRHRRALRVSCIEHNLVAFPGDNGWFQASVQQKTGEYQVSFLCLTEGALNKNTTVKTLKKHTNNYNFKFSLNLTSTNTGKTVRNLMCRSDDIHMHVTFLCKITLCNLVVK